MLSNYLWLFWSELTERPDLESLALLLGHLLRHLLLRLYSLYIEQNLNS